MLGSSKSKRQHIEYSQTCKYYSLLHIILSHIPSTTYNSPLLTISGIRKWLALQTLRELISVRRTLLEDMLMLTYISAAKEEVAQASASYQMQQWLLQSDKEAPWTPLSLSTVSSRHINAKSVVNENMEDTSSNCAAQGSTPSSASTPEKSI
jgi:hypothetical protein